MALLADISRVVPRSYPRHVRDDIVGSMCLAIAERKLKAANLAAEAPKFIRAYWKKNSPYETVSLDVPVGDGNTTLLDSLSEDRGLAAYL